MAHLPPRKVSISNKSCKQNQTPLQILLQMGFPKHRALKALAATGNRSVQLASDWLLTHVRDTSLDADCPREYILYACPSGPLLAQLHKFWQDSKALGWNGAHNYPPHITLVSFFKAPDEYSLQLEKFLKQVIENVGETDHLKLEPYISQNFMGLFVCEEHADYLRRIALQYVKKVSNATGLAVDTYDQMDALITCFPWCAMPQDRPKRSICLEPHVKSLHITLAYQFPVNDFPLLKNLVEQMKPLADCSWELRLYSRDSRFSNHLVHKVIQEYEPKESDELELVIGDYIYIDGDQLKNSTDGWVQGTSWLTGVTGLLPAVYTERTAESDSWTLHKAIPLINNKSEEMKPEAEGPVDGNDAEEIGSAKSEEFFAEWEQKYRAVYTNTVKAELENPESSPDVSNHVDDKQTDNEAKEETDNRWVFAMRHGERVDFTYGSWVPHCFDSAGRYTRKDLNMPVELPERRGGHLDYVMDGPLTRVGELQAYLVGEAMRLAKVEIHRVYSSPAYRSVQTAHHVLRGLEYGEKVKICIEPGIFEYKGWYTNGLPNFMTPEELMKSGLCVDLSYKPYVEWSENPETLDEFSERNKKTIDSIYNDTPNENLMLVGHGCTLDLANKALNPSTTPYTINAMLGRVPYCAISTLKGRKLVAPPIPPHINTSSPRFRWQTLIGK